MQASLDNLSRMAGGAAMEMAGAVRTFADIGIRVQDVNGTIKDTAVLLDEIGNAVTHLENSQIFALERPGLDRTLIRSMTEDMTALVAEFDGMAGATGVNFARSSKTASKLMDELGKTRTFTGILSKALGTELMEDLVTGLQRARQKIRDNFSSIKWDIDVAVKTGTMLATTFIERNARRWCGSIPKRRARPRPLSP